MVLKNLFTGQNGETGIENRLMDMGRGDKSVRCMERVTWKLTSPYVKWIVNGNLLCGSGNSSRALYQPRGEGWGGRWRGRFKRERIYIYIYG